jgi:endogenous inhibitor of DNA gyrase (YacG/DUF329 family)
MRACKQCNKPIPVKSYGLRRFCSTVCKAIYRREYLKQKKQQERQKNNVNNTDGYDNTYSTMSTIPDGLEQITDTKITLNPEDLRVAKECCNYEMKQVVGYCITLHEPYYGFKTDCKDCFIFHCLKQALSRSKYGRIISRAC